MLKTETSIRILSYNVINETKIISLAFKYHLYELLIPITYRCYRLIIFEVLRESTNLNYVPTVVGQKF